MLCRNVLIYFDVETKQQILGRIRQVLRPDGYLFLGAAETTLNLDDGYERVAVGRSSTYQPRAGRPPARPALARPAAAVPRPPATAARPAVPAARPAIPSRPNPAGAGSLPDRTR